MQNQATYEQYEEPVNYLGAIIGALVGGAIAVGIWAAGVYYLDVIYYQLLAFVGGFVGLGAILLARGNNWKIGLLSALITIVALLAGDYIQMMYVSGENSLSIEEYIEFSQMLLSENAIQYFVYLAAIGIAFYVGTFGNRSGAEVAAGR